NRARRHTGRGARHGPPGVAARRPARQRRTLKRFHGPDSLPLTARITPAGIVYPWSAPRSAPSSVRRPVFIGVAIQKLGDEAEQPVPHDDVFAVAHGLERIGPPHRLIEGARAMNLHQALRHTPEL